MNIAFLKIAVLGSIISFGLVGCSHIVKTNTNATNTSNVNVSANSNEQQVNTNGTTNSNQSSNANTSTVNISDWKLFSSNKERIYKDQWPSNPSFDIKYPKDWEVVYTAQDRCFSFMSPVSIEENKKEDFDKTAHYDMYICAEGGQYSHPTIEQFIQDYIPAIRISNMFSLNIGGFQGYRFIENDGLARMHIVLSSKDPSVFMDIGYHADNQFTSINEKMISTFQLL